jgi:hypothetical protein
MMTVYEKWHPKEFGLSFLSLGLQGRKRDLLFIAIDLRTSHGPGLGYSGDSLLQGNRPECLVEVDWPLVLVSTKQSKDNSSISSAIDNMSCSPHGGGGTVSGVGDGETSGIESSPGHGVGVSRCLSASGLFVECRWRRLRVRQIVNRCPYIFHFRLMYNDACFSIRETGCDR